MRSTACYICNLVERRSAANNVENFKRPTRSTTFLHRLPPQGLNVLLYAQLPRGSHVCTSRHDDLVAYPELTQPAHIMNLGNVRAVLI